MKVFETVYQPVELTKIGRVFQPSKLRKRLMYDIKPGAGNAAKLFVESYELDDRPNTQGGAYLQEIDTTFRFRRP